MVTPSYPDERNIIHGGVAGVSFYLTSALAQQFGVEVCVFVTGSKAPRGTVRKAECRVEHIPNTRGLLGSQRGLAREIERRARDLCRDLVHSQGSSAVIRGVTLPCLLTVHGINEFDTLFRHGFFSGRLRSAWIRWTEGCYRKQIQNVILTSPCYRNLLSLEQTIWELENPIPDSFFSVTRTPQKRRLLFMGTVTRRKNVHGLIQAFALFRRNHGCGDLVIAGSVEQDRQYYSGICQLIQEYGLSKQVQFKGPLTVKEIQQELSLCEALVLSSFQETAPLSISEAMAAGVPVLGPNICGVPYMVEEGVTGRLVDPCSVQNILAGLERLLFEDDLPAMSLQARKVAQLRFHASSVAAKTFEIYQTLLTRH